MQKCRNKWTTLNRSLIFKFSIGFILFFTLIVFYASMTNLDDAAGITIQNKEADIAPQGPVLNNTKLKIDEIFKGLENPTSMAFLGQNDILALEKNNGTVQRILNGKLVGSVLDVNVATKDERGMLGIAVAKPEGDLKESNMTTNTNVFLYYTESAGGKDSDDVNAGVEPLGNRLYRYELVNNKLVIAKLLLDLPATPVKKNTERQHMGGKVVIGPDKNVYVGIGDVGKHKTQAENNNTGLPPSGTGGILRVTQSGQAVRNSPLGDMGFLKYYYAYGIRNTFGMDFDPLTGTLWDTENGPKFGDEINIVQPGFNSGWIRIQGMAKDHLTGIAVDPATGLVNFGGKGIYRDPEFVWITPIGVTAIKFLNSTKLGKQYQNTIFVGDFDTGNIYNFKLNHHRTELLLDSVVADKVANIPDEMSKTIFGQGFGAITDLQVGPDGYLYVLTLAGSIFRISPLA